MVVWSPIVRLGISLRFWLIGGGNVRRGMVLEPMTRPLRMRIIRNSYSETTGVEGLAADDIFRPAVGIDGLAAIGILQFW